MKDYSQLLLQKKDFIKGTSSNFLLIYYNLPFIYMDTFACQLRMCIFPFFPSMHMQLLSKKYSFFGPKCSLHPEVHCLTVFLQGHCKRIKSCKYTIIHSDAVQVLMLWQRKVGAFMNLNIFHINYVNIMINNQLHSLFKTCNVAFS